VRAWVGEQGQSTSAPQLDAQIERIARAGGTPLLLADEKGLLAVIALKDILSPT